MRCKRGFASDNNAGIHENVLKAIEESNYGHCIGYGDDPFTESAKDKFREYFGNDVDVYFVFTGTAANVMGLSAVTRTFHSIICSELSHLNVDECGAPENFSGTKLLTVPTPDGKIKPGQIEPLLSVFGNEHHVQPKVISVTQATEVGTVYGLDEIRALSEIAHRNSMLLHMDGARIANAAAFLGTDLKTITVDAGVDVLSFGGTKNGMMAGEAVVFFDPKLSEEFKYIRKQGMQLFSKMRYISAQFSAYLTDGLWLSNARHANEMAELLASRLADIPGTEIIQEVQANGVFAIIPGEYVEAIQKEYFFYVWDEKGPVVRLMTSWDTQEEDIELFIVTLKRIMGV
ncbi:MAG TPA: low specificity L-threonine aldolase [Spirochaetota bacterium]|nr:low specificity L-threonine aldolase [Spirochaetota bacterium]